MGTSFKSSVVVTNLAMAAIFTGCDSKKKSTAYSSLEANEAPASTALKISLPDRAPMKTQFANIETLLSGYSISIKPTSGSNCIDYKKVAPYAEQSSLAQSLLQGCDYLVEISLGTLDPNAQDSLKTVYYVGKQTIKSSDIAGKPTFALVLDVFLTIEGKNLGLPGALAPTPAPTAAPSPAPSASPQPSALPPQPNPSPTASPSSPALPVDKDIPLTVIKVGQPSEGNKRLSDFFKGEYLLLDFSASSCGPCLSMAEEIEKNKALLSGTKCSFITILAKGDGEAWAKAIQSHSFGVAHVAEGSGSVVALSKKVLGEGISATPSFAFINRQGQLEGKISEGELPRDLAAKCSN